MMAPSSDRDREGNESQRKPDNPFIKFRNFADSQISSLLQGIIGLPSAFTKNPDNARWTDFDEEMRRRDELQARQRVLRDSEARKAEQQSKAGRPHWLNAHTAAGDMDDKTVRDIPLYSPVSKSLFSHLPIANEDRWGGSAEWRPIPEDKALQFATTPIRSYLHHLSPITTLQSTIYSDLNSNGILRSQYSLLPYLLFSPYSPLKLEMDAEIELQPNTIPYCDAFQDLILMTRGNVSNSGGNLLNPPRRILGSSDNGNSSPLDPAVGPDRTWIYRLWASGTLQESGSTTRPDVAAFQDTLHGGLKESLSSQKSNDEDAQTEQEMYDLFLRRASSFTGATEILESLFIDAEAWINAQMASLDPAEMKRQLKKVTHFLEQKTGDEEEDKKREKAVKALEAIFDQTVGLFRKPQDDTKLQKRKEESFAETKVGKELEDLQRKATADPKAVFVSTTTEHTSHEDGSVETSVTVWKRFADGRETTTTTSHVEGPGYGNDIDDDDEGNFEEQTGFPKVPEKKNKDEKSEQKGWFWK